MFSLLNASVKTPSIVNSFEEQFHEIIKRRLEKHSSSPNNPLRKKSASPKITQTHPLTVLGIR